MTEQTGIMTQVDSNISVGMGEVVNVFLAKYENKLHSDREDAQREVIRLNKLVQEVTEVATERFKLFVEEANTGSWKNEFISITTGFLKDFTVVMNQGHVSTKLETTVLSNMVTKSDHSEWLTTSVTINVPIGADLILDYNSLMEQKSVQTSLLAKINADLRDINRKERQIRGRIAEMKLKDMGMEQLLMEPTLLSLINESGM